MNSLPSHTMLLSPSSPPGVGKQGVSNGCKVNVDIEFFLARNTSSPQNNLPVSPSMFLLTRGPK